MIKLYKVGGMVRDQLMNITPKDIDYAVEAHSYDEMVDYIKSRGKIYLEKPEYFTVRGRIDNIDADFVLCRKDGEYKDGRRPETVEVGTIYDDLARRDFTMNAIAIDETGKYIDPHDGRHDINNKIIRCVGDAKKRFEEDGLRMLRAIRFQITKDFVIDRDIFDLLSDDKFVFDNLKGVSVDRIREEINKGLSHNSFLMMNILWNRYFYVAEYIFKNTDLKLKMTNEKF